MDRWSRWVSRVWFVIAIVTGIGSIVAFAACPLGSLRLLRPPWSEGALLLWDVGLSLLFFLQHSGMTRRPVRARLATLLAPRTVPAAYAVASGVALGLVTLLWQPTATHLYSLAGAPRVAAHAVSIAGAALFFWGSRTLRSFDPMGLKPLLGRAPPAPPEPREFAARGAYGLVRHPLYLAVVMLIWAHPDVTLDRLAFNVLWTAWIVVGTVLEEADLVAETGESYRTYQRRVPMLVPWTRARAERRAGEQPS